MPDLFRVFTTSDFLLRVPALLIAIVLHELAHGLVAYRLGDGTAKAHGRLTLNPLKHLDPIGTLALLVVGFGWAKPVPVNPMYFHGDRRRGMFLVGLAGPATNFLIAFVTLILLFTVPVLQAGVVLQVVLLVIFFNVVLGVFNLIPIPPLDGSKVLAYLVPRQAAQTLAQLEQYGPVLLILAIFTGVLGRILWPIVNFVYSLLVTIAVFITGGI